MAPSKMSPLAEDILLVFLPVPEDTAFTAALEARYPGLRVRWEPHTDSVTGQTRAVQDLPPSAWDGVSLLMSVMPPPAQLMARVRFVQMPSAGADRWLSHEKFHDEGVVFCSANGSHA